MLIRNYKHHFPYTPQGGLNSSCESLPGDKDGRYGSSRNPNSQWWLLMTFHKESSSLLAWLLSTHYTFTTRGRDQQSLQLFAQKKMCNTAAPSTFTSLSSVFRATEPELLTKRVFSRRPAEEEMLEKTKKRWLCLNIGYLLRKEVKYLCIFIDCHCGSDGGWKW